MTSRAETYKGIDIRKNNIQAQPTVEVDNEFRLVKSGIDMNLFPATTTAIKIIGTTHNTTNNGKTKDKSHLTLSVNPGGKSAHLYLLPDDGIAATATTTVSHLTF